MEQELNESKTRLEENEAKMKSLVTEKKEIESNFNRKMQDLQDQIVELRAQNVRLSTQTQYAEEKEKLLQVSFVFVFNLWNYTC